jgi:hypothetical protein
MIREILKEAQNIIYTGGVTGLSTASATLLESATSSQNGYGYIGDSSQVLCNQVGGVPLIANTHFVYDQRLDSGTYNIYDTAVSGTFASGKCLRIVENAKNITDATGLNLQVWAKYMPNTSSLIIPPYNVCYIDPVSRLFVLPQPNYLSKCESAANLTSPDMSPTISFNTSYNGRFYMGYGYSTFTLGVTTGKWGNCIYTHAGGDANHLATWTDFNYNIINTAGVAPQGTISFWFKARLENAVWSGGYAAGGTATINFYLGATSYYAFSYSSTDNIDSGWMHAYIVWDTAKTLTGGKSVLVFINGAASSSSTASIDTSLVKIYTYVYGVSAHSEEYGYYDGAGLLYIDNVKVWTSIYENPTFEYNGGAGVEGSSYILSGTSGVGYIAKGSSTAPVVITGTGGLDTTATSDDPVILVNAQGTFGPVGGSLCTSDLVPLSFTYDKRLDSTSDGGVDVFDTGITGSLASGKYFRITDNGVNVKSLTGITQVIAKNLNTMQSPPSNIIYIDPISGKYVLPQPIYWSKCESLNNMTSPEIGNAILTYDFARSSGYPTNDVFKFGKGVGANSGTSFSGNCSKRFQIISNLETKYTISSWITTGGIFYDPGTYSMGVVSYDLGNLSIQQVSCIPNFTSGTALFILISGSIIASVNIGTSSHIFINIDSNAGLSGGKTVRIYANGIDVLSTTNVFTINSPLQFSYGAGCYVNGFTGYASVDNIKIWNHAIEDPEFEYNSGTGRESALHPCYGSSDGYAPLNNTTRYYRSGASNNKSIISI